MKLARILLASAAVALLAACDSNPVAPSDQREAPRARQILITSDTTGVDVDVDGPNSITEQDAIPCVPVTTTVTVGGITTTVTLCETRGPQIGSGGH